MTLAIYCRISKLKEDGKDRSIDNQKKIGIAKAKKLKMEHRLYVDEGLSGTLEKIEDRPALNNMLKDIIDGEIDAVFAYDQSRFERSPEIRSVLMNIFKKNEIAYYTHMDGAVDLKDPQTQLFGDMVSLFNKYEVTKTRIRVKGILKQRAEEGKAHGIMPYGYGRDEKGFIKVDAAEEKIIKRIFSLSLKGTGTRSIAGILNKEKIPTRSGTLWSISTVNQMLKNKIYYCL